MMLKISNILVFLLMFLVLTTISSTPVLSQQDCSGQIDFYMVAIEQLDDENYEDAIAYLTCAIQADPEHYDAIYQRGIVYQEIYQFHQIRLNLGCVDIST